MNKYIQYSLVVLVIMIISRASILSCNITIYALLCVFSLLFLSMHRKLDVFVIVILLLWVAINALADLLLGLDFRANSVIRTYLHWIILPYLILKVYTGEFWQKFERIAFWLTALSIPAYIFNVLFSHFFSSTLSNVFQLTTQRVFTGNPFYWSAFVYTNALHSTYFPEGLQNILLRNAGFMWEPGAFAMVIIWVLIYNRLTGQGKKYRTAICYVALLTTFSTAGYFALTLLLISRYIRTFTIRNTLVVSLILCIFIIFVYDLAFMSGKLINYVSAFDINAVHYTTDYGFSKINRLGTFYAEIRDSLIYPLGYGYSSVKTLFQGTNGISGFVKTWGILPFLFSLHLLKKHFVWLTDCQITTFSFYFLFTSFLVMLFSNPIDRGIFLYLIILSPLTLQNRKIIW